jgi:hypothetical protein
MVISSKIITVITALAPLAVLEVAGSYLSGMTVSSLFTLFIFTVIKSSLTVISMHLAYRLRFAEQ